MDRGVTVFSAIGSLALAAQLDRGSRHVIVCKRTGEAIAIKLDGGACACPSADKCALAVPLDAVAPIAADRGPVQDERASMDPVDRHAMRAIEKGPAVNRTAPGGPGVVVFGPIEAPSAGHLAPLRVAMGSPIAAELSGLAVGALLDGGALVWADTGMPVLAGDLVVGEGFEVNLMAGTARRLSADELAEAAAELTPDAGE